MSVLESASIDRVAGLAAVVLGTPFASVVVAGRRFSLGGMRRANPAMSGGQDRPSERPPGQAPVHRDLAGQALVEQALCQQVTESGQPLIIVDSRLDPRIGAHPPAGPPGAIAWAVLPVHDQSRSVVGALCVADQVPRWWSISDLAALETLALLASAEVALESALARGAEHAALAETLQQCLAPQRLRDIPGVQVAARYSAGAGASVLGDFYDVFPSVRGSWGLVVGDVCGRGVPAATGTVLARFTLRAEARRRSQAEPHPGQPESGSAGLADR